MEGEWVAIIQAWDTIEIKDGDNNLIACLGFDTLVKPSLPKIMKQHANARLIVTAVNACKKLNPDNPMAVADTISDLYEALKALKFQFAMAVEHPYSKDKEVYEQAEQALAKADGK